MHLTLLFGKREDIESPVMNEKETDAGRPEGEVAMETLFHVMLTEHILRYCAAFRMEAGLHRMAKIVEDRAKTACRSYRICREEGKSEREARLRALKILFQELPERP